MKIVSLASGSGGNAYIAESSGVAIMVDCGLCYSELKKRAAIANVDLKSVAGVLFTHEHTDHTKGAEVFRKRHPGTPFYANFSTADRIGGEFLIFENGQTFNIGPFEVTAFSIPHDVSDPVGYTIVAEGKTYFHATDIGSPLKSIGMKLAQADVATLESNHDPVLLRMSRRPESLKSRICGERGHLSNSQAAELVKDFASTRLKYLALAHLSQECNEPHLAKSEMLNALQEKGRSDIKLEVLSQDAPSEGWVC